MSAAIREAYHGVGERKRKTRRRAEKVVDPPKLTKFVNSAVSTRRPTRLGLRVGAPWAGNAVTLLSMRTTSAHSLHGTDRIEGCRYSVVAFGSCFAGCATVSFLHL